MTADLSYLQHLRERHETLFDRCLCSALLEQAGFEMPTLNGDEIWHLCPRRKRLAILRGEDAALAVLAHLPKIDLALERLTGQPSRVGVETLKDILGLTVRQAQGSAKRLLKSYQGRFSREQLDAVIDRLLDRTAALVLEHLQKTGRLNTVHQGAAHG